MIKRTISFSCNIQNLKRNLKLIKQNGTTYWRCIVIAHSEKVMGSNCYSDINEFIIRMGSHVVFVRIHCTEKCPTSFYNNVLSESK